MTMQRDTDRLAAVAQPDPDRHQLESGEVIDLPADLWTAIDEAIGRTCGIEDAGEARTAFANALVAALFRHGHILVQRARSQSRHAVDADLYSLALSAKHAAERELQAVRGLVLGKATPAPADPPLLDDLGRGVLALAGRAPPSDLSRIVAAVARVQVLAARLAGADDVAEVHVVAPLPDGLLAFFEEKVPPHPGEGQAIR